MVFIVVSGDYTHYIYPNLRVAHGMIVVCGDYNLYRAYIGISHRGTLVGVHPTIP